MELRYEYKYAVRIDKEQELRRMLSPFVAIDRHAIGRENNEYTVRSIYFDTPDFKFYHDKVDGLSYRKKVRLRGYNQLNGANPVFLETKNKFLSPLHKTRAKMSFENALESFEEDNYPLILEGMSKNYSQANSFIYQLLSKNLRPVILIIYDRIPFTEIIDTPNRLRITFDKKLRSSSFPKINELYEENETVDSLKGYFILEVKFNLHYPVWMNSIITKLQLKRQSLSKYVISIDEHQMIQKFNRFQVLEKKFI